MACVVAGCRAFWVGIGFVGSGLGVGVRLSWLLRALGVGVWGVADFLSHSSRDNRAAVALKRWLAEQRPELANEIFLDIDPESAMQPGARWKSQLFESNSRCETVICLLSRSWEASHECKTEYRTAEGLG
jgi:hypothetical protein